MSVEDRLRAALHEGGETITQEGLRKPTPPAPRPARGWVVAASCAAALVVVVPIVVYSADRHTGVDAQRQRPGYIGYKWLVDSVTKDGVTTQVPGTLVARMTFLQGGALYAEDTVNFLSGQFRAGDGVVRTQLTAGTLAHYSGNDPVQRLVIDAVNAVGNARMAPVSVNEDDELTIEADGYRIVFRREAPAHPRVS